MRGNLAMKTWRVRTKPSELGDDTVQTSFGRYAVSGVAPFGRIRFDLEPRK